MIIADHNQGWESKVNFVDENGVYVGYDLAQDCCEDTGWFISKSCDEIYEYSKSLGLDKPVVDGYNFDINFFKDIESKDLDEGGQVCFRLTHKDKPELFLHLYNSHNGYYSHGFETNVKGIGEDNYL